jgi:hypothetical protein
MIIEKTHVQVCEKEMTAYSCIKRRSNLFMPVVLKYISDICNHQMYAINLKFHCVPNINLNVTVGYEVLQPDPSPECEYDIDYRTRRRRDRENRQNSCDSP